VVACCSPIEIHQQLVRRKDLHLGQPCQPYQQRLLWRSHSAVLLKPPPPSELEPELLPLQLRVPAPPQQLAPLAVETTRQGATGGPLAAE
jgi:hypothetical protein